MSVKSPSDYPTENTQYERKPTGGIQAIAEKPFTVNHIDSFTSKVGEEMCIITTDETFPNIEYKDVNDEKVKGSLNRFFASPRDIKKFFRQESVIDDVNTKGDKIKTKIQLVNFSAEEVAKSPKLKGKSHYVFVTESKQKEIA